MTHAWCSDPARDEAVRAAEDAAASERTPLPDHRDLPQAVAELRELVGRVIEEMRERVGRLEEATVSGSTWFPICDMPAPPPPPAPPQPVPVDPAHGMRTERVTLEVTHDCKYPAAEWVLDIVQEACSDPGESVRVVEEATMPEDTAREMRAIVRMRDPEVARLTAERDAALRERDAAKARAAEYEKTRKWDIEKIEDGCIRVCFGDHHRAVDCEWEYFVPVSREADLQNQRSGAIRERDLARARVAELENAAKLAPGANAGGEANQPQPPRGWLTAEDCEALYLANAALHGVFVGSWREKHDASKRLEAIRVRAIREAGGEVV